MAFEARRPLAVLALLCVALLPRDVIEAAPWIGGSSAAAPLATTLLNNQNAKQSAFPKEYASSKSTDGIDGVKSGKFRIGVSTIPFPAKKEVGFKKLTIPQTVLTVSLFTNSKGGLRLSAAQIARIWLGQIRMWEEVKGSNLRGPIKVIARSDAAGVTQIVTTYLLAAAPSIWPTKFVGEGPFAFGNPNILYVSGAAGVAAATASIPFSLGWSQTGTGRYFYGLQEVAIQNRVNKYVALTTATRVDYLGALPRVPPLASSSWAGVKLIWTRGRFTFPVVSLVYFFYRPSYKKSIGASVKAFGAYTQTVRAQNLAQGFFFYPLPSAYTKQGKAAIASIKLT